MRSAKIDLQTDPKRFLAPYTLSHLEARRDRACKIGADALPSQSEVAKEPAEDEVLHDGKLGQHLHLVHLHHALVHL